MLDFRRAKRRQNALSSLGAEEDLSHQFATRTSALPRAYDGMDSGGMGLQLASSSTSSYKPKRHMEHLIGDYRRMSYASDTASTVGRSRGDEMPSTTPVGSYINGVLGGKLHPGLVDDNSDEQETNDSEPEPEIEVLDEEGSADASATTATDDAKTFVQATADKIVELRTENLRLHERLQAAERQLKQSIEAPAARPLKEEEESTATIKTKENTSAAGKMASSLEVPSQYRNGSRPRHRPVAAKFAERSLSTSPQPPSRSLSLSPLDSLLPSRSPSPSPSPLLSSLPMSVPTLDGELAVTERRVHNLEASALQLKRRLAGPEQRSQKMMPASRAKPQSPPPTPSPPSFDAVELRQSAAKLRQQMEKSGTPDVPTDVDAAAKRLQQLVDLNQTSLRRRMQDSKTPVDQEELRHLAAAGAHLRECLARLEDGLRSELESARAALAETEARAASRERRLANELQLTRRRLAQAASEAARARADEVKREDAGSGMAQLLATVGAENRSFQRRLAQLADSVQRDSMAGPDTARQLRDLASHVRTDYELPSANNAVLGGDTVALSRELSRLQARLQDSEARCGRALRDLQRSRREQRLAVKKLTEYEAQLYCARQEISEKARLFESNSTTTNLDDVHVDGTQQQQQQQQQTGSGGSGYVRRQSQVHLAALIEHFDLIESGVNNGAETRFGRQVDEATPVRSGYRSNSSDGRSTPRNGYVDNRTLEMKQQQQQQRRNQAQSPEMQSLVRMLLSNSAAQQQAS